jgi:hypothetical protein
MISHYSFDAALHDYTTETAGHVDQCDGIAVCSDIMIGSTKGSKFDAFTFDSGKGTKEKVAGIVTAFDIQKGIKDAQLDVYMASDAADYLIKVVGKLVALEEVKVTASLKTWGKDAKFTEQNRKLKKQYQPLDLKATLVTTTEPVPLGKFEISKGNFIWGFSIKLAPIPSSPVKVSVDPIVSGAPTSFWWGVA